MATLFPIWPSIASPCTDRRWTQAGRLLTYDHQFEVPEVRPTSHATMLLTAAKGFAWAQASEAQSGMIGQVTSKKKPRLRQGFLMR